MDDISYIKSYCDGDQSSAQTLYDRYVDRVYRFVFSKINNKALSQDICADTFFKAFSQLHTYDQQRGNFATWLLHIAYNCTVDALRKEQHTHCYDRLVESTADTHTSSINDQLNASIQREHVQSYLKELATDQREILMMRLWDKLSYEEISIITGKSSVACKQSVYRSLQSIKDKFGHLFGFIAFLQAIGSIYQA